MIVDLSNSDMKVSINTLGGELSSILTDQGEYLWQGDPKYWSGKAPNLFPYIARLTEGKYSFRGKQYTLDKHGFVRHTELTVTQSAPDSAVFSMHSDAETQRYYPFSFEYQIHYQLLMHTLMITCRVINEGDDMMYFGIGGHPGFRVPMETGLHFEDYYLEFENLVQPIRVGFTEDCFVNGEEESFPLQENRLALTHNLFDKDAIILKNMGTSVLLRSDHGEKGVRLTCRDMKYFGIWHMPKTDAPYVCLEPWSSLPSRKGIIEDLETQKDLVSLQAHDIYNYHWQIECLG